jgi:bifunctional non-homologous end joining protein LigD
MAGIVVASSRAEIKDHRHDRTQADSSRGTRRVRLTSLDEELFDGAQATKRELVDYLDAVRGLFIPALDLLRVPVSSVAMVRGNC